MNTFKIIINKQFTKTFLLLIVLFTILSVIFNFDFSLFFEFFHYDFLVNALIVGSLVAFCSAFLGTFLVLKKYSMIGDGLAHVSFAAIAVAVVFGALQYSLIISILIVTIASFLILKLNEKAELHGDAAIGLVSSFAIAIGVLLVNLNTKVTINIEDYLLGSILAIEPFDVYLSIALSLVVLFTIIFFYHSFFAITYDEEFAKVNGTNTKVINYLLSILTSITIVLGIRIIGTMLISSMIIFPTVSALQISKGFKQTILISTLISLFSVIFGLFSSFLFNLPPGTTIVLLNGLIFIVLFIIKRLNLK